MMRKGNRMARRSTKTVRDILNKIEYQYHLVLFIRDEKGVKMYEDEQVKKLPEDILNKRVKSREIRRQKYVVHVELEV